jgi:hypothetical protein
MASSLSGLPGHELLARLRSLVRRGNAVEAELLVHLGEVEVRRLYLEEACSSIFVYCQRVLHFSESVAYKRIHAARAARRHPAVLEAVRRGDLHVTGVTLLAPQLTGENCADLLRGAKHKTAEEIRRLLADRRPMPDVKASVRRVPATTASVIAGSSAGQKSLETPAPNGTTSNRTHETELVTIGRRSPASAAPAVPSSPQCNPETRARTEPLGGERYCVRFTADPETHAQLQELRALMRHQIPDGDLGKILARAVTSLLEQVRRRKLGECAAPRAAKPSGARPSRQIPAAIRRKVWSRDGGRCTYVSPAGRRCQAREFLEFHHREPWAKNREHTVAGIALCCRAHNQHEAGRDFGERHMARFRGSARPAEPAPVQERSGRAPHSQLDSNPDREDEPLATGSGARPPEAGRLRRFREPSPVPDPLRSP